MTASALVKDDVLQLPLFVLESDCFRRLFPLCQVSMEVMSVAQDIARVLQSRDVGCALLVDYGEDHLMPPTLQGIREHKIVHPLSQPGLVDLSAYVDFSSVRAAVQSFNHQKAVTTVVHGPVTQQQFLFGTGIAQRLEVCVFCFALAPISSLVFAPPAQRDEFLFGSFP